MAQVPSVDEALERARRAQDSRMDTVRGLAEASQELERHRAAVTDAEQQHGIAYASALNAGWTTAELKRIGFPDPAAKPRRRRAKKETETAGATVDHTAPPQ